MSTSFTIAKINSLPDQASGITHFFLRKLHVTLHMMMMMMMMNTSEFQQNDDLSSTFFIARHELPVYYKVEMCAKMRAMITHRLSK